MGRGRRILGVILVNLPRHIHYEGGQCLDAAPGGSVSELHVLYFEIGFGYATPGSLSCRCCPLSNFVQQQYPPPFTRFLTTFLSILCPYHNPKPNPWCYAYRAFGCVAVGEYSLKRCHPIPGRLGVDLCPSTGKRGSAS
jgi:hypothetical protein